MGLLKLTRPKQWIKQSFVIIPLISLGSAFSPSDFIKGVLAVFTFTCLASCVYIYNDYSDLEYDKRDPIRHQRPIASGRVSLRNAFLLGIVLLINSFVITIFFSKDVLSSLLLLVFYLLINVVYSKFNLKRKNILGITIVGAGFPIRFAFGCSFAGVPFSYWAITMLMLLALFMLSIKRYQLTLRSSGKNVDSDHEFWLIAAITFAAFFSASYAGFVSSPLTQHVWGSTALLFSSIPVALGIVRFIELGTNKSKIIESDVTETVAKDIPILVLCFVYAGIMILGRISTN